MREDYRQHGKRSAIEVRIPGKKPGDAPRYVALGHMSTARQNDSVLALPSRVVYATGPFGEHVARQRRPKRADGSRAPIPDNVGEIADGLTPDQVQERLHPNARIVREADEVSLRLVKAEVMEALFYGARLRMRWRVVQEHDQLRTIPDKGKVVRWGSVDDLVQALVQGVPF